MREDLSRFEINAPKGKVTVELFNERGKKVEEIKKDNYVNPSFMRAMSRLATSALISPLALNSNSSQNSISNGAGINNLFGINYAAGILLVNNPKTPRPELDMYPEGKIIGMASINNIGARAKVGTYNFHESMHTFNYHKYVYDFATSEANGEFNSIYAGPYNVYNRNNSPSFPSYSTAPTVKFRDSSSDDSIEKMDSHNNKIYILAGNVLYIVPVAELNKYMNTSSSTSSSSTGTSNIEYAIMNNPNVEKFNMAEAIKPYHHDSSSSSSGTSVTSFTIVGNDMYFMSGNYERIDGSLVKAIFKAPLSNLSDISVWATYTYSQLKVTSNNSMSWIDDIFYDHYHNRLVIILNDNPDKWGYIDLQTKEISLWNTPPISDLSYAQVQVIKDQPNLISAAGYLYDRENTQYIAAYNHAEVAHTPIDRDFALYRVSASRLYILPRAKFLSRATLDVPVTKTTQNTMKITYEFEVDGVNFGQH